MATATMHHHSPPAASSAMANTTIRMEVHEFVVIYEGPPSPHVRWKDGREDKDDNYDDDYYYYDDDDDDDARVYRHGRRGGGEKGIIGNDANRQVHCLSLPSAGKSMICGRSYVCEDELLEALAMRIGWPSSFLCISGRHRPASSSSSSSKYPSPLLFQDFGDHHPTILRASIAPRLSSIRGGKGGFGTLLRGQSKQAGARTTIDFGACRDLSGRRLRHVNDEIKLRRFREMQSAIERGDRAGAERAEMSALSTPSGIRNWHLAVPGWSEHGGSANTNKGRRAAERQLHNEVRGYRAREGAAKDAMERRRMDRELAISEYVRRMETEGGRVIALSGMGGETTVKDGILAHYRKRREEKGGGGGSKRGGDGGGGDGVGGASSTTISNDEGAVARSADVDATASAPSSAAASARYLMTLSGEMSAFDIPIDEDAARGGVGMKDPSAMTSATTTATTNTNKLRIQSQSDFATAVVLLDSVKTRERIRGNTRGVYVEYTMRTAGLAQIGWVRVGGLDDGASGAGGGTFMPNSDAGDGVGDDAASYGYDGSRGLKFHDGEEIAYGFIPSLSSAEAGGSASPVEWKVGDVLGCYCKVSESDADVVVKIGYSLNGANLGTAFDVSIVDGEAFRFYPAISLNLNEVVDVNIGPNFAHSDPRDGCSGACELVVTGVADAEDYARDIIDGEERSLNEVDDKMDPPKKRPRDESLMGQKVHPAKGANTTNHSNDVESTKPTASSDTFDLNKCSSVEELKVLGSERLKHIMLSMGVKCGGTLDERATRLFSLKGLRRDEYPNKVRGKNFIQ